jgi:hypothetical protein
MMKNLSTKNTYIHFLFVVLVLLNASCQTQQKTENGGIDTTAPISDLFASFVAKFPQESKSLPATFGEEWLDRQISPLKIDSAEVRLFLLGNLIINHELMVGGSDAREIELDAKKTYYYISKIPLGTGFVSLIVSDMEKDATNTYLLNYTPEGKFITGIVMQCRYEIRDGEDSNKVARESVISDSQMILCQEKLVGRNKFVSYDVTAEGQIIKRN